MQLSTRWRARLNWYSIHQGLLRYPTKLENALRIVIPYDEEYDD